MGMHDAGGEGNYGIKTQASGDLELAIAPPNGQHLAETRESKEDDDSHDGECLLQAEVNQPIRHQLVDWDCQAGNGPEEGADEGDKDRNAYPCMLGQGGANGAQDRPCQFDQDGEKHGRTDHLLCFIELEVGGGRNGLDREEYDVAEEAPTNEEGKGREGMKHTI